jgi:hypothetical protein
MNLQRGIPQSRLCAKPRPHKQYWRWRTSRSAAGHVPTTGRRRAVPRLQAERWIFCHSDHGDRRQCGRDGPCGAGTQRATTVAGMCCCRCSDKAALVSRAARKSVTGLKLASLGGSVAMERSWLDCDAVHARARQPAVLTESPLTGTYWRHLSRTTSYHLVGLSGLGSLAFSDLFAHCYQKRQLSSGQKPSVQTHPGGQPLRWRTPTSTLLTSVQQGTGCSRRC